MATYREIQANVEIKYGFVSDTCWIGPKLKNSAIKLYKSEIFPMFCWLRVAEL